MFACTYCKNLNKNSVTGVVHLALAHSNNSCMSGVTPGLRIDMVKHSCHSYLGALPLSALGEWHYSWVRYSLHCPQNGISYQKVFMLDPYQKHRNTF